MSGGRNCQFRCGSRAEAWDWIGLDRETHPAAAQDITVYACPTCGSYGIAERIEASFGGNDKWDQAIERQFLLMRPVLIRRRPKEAPQGSSLIGVFALKKDNAGIELVFMTPGDRTH